MGKYVARHRIAESQCRFIVVESRFKDPFVIVQHTIAEFHYWNDARKFATMKNKETK